MVSALLQPAPSVRCPGRTVKLFYNGIRCSYLAAAEFVEANVDVWRPRWSILIVIARKSFDGGVLGGIGSVFGYGSTISKNVAVR